ncbi:carboxymuconolactone decarboxylase family protein [uncultured Pseudoflavonifractor sp.]|uniref:carboxymuconolactone decarboxylase family protein n=1 Tax=uncultured Pseudoflavonifractor sp. TaxID=1221379 RepID=UPI0025D6263B|nr:carboxymuconolactone decarboxylase family protein [uncultured Pseudoflavonifractor sp.]
MELSMSAKQYCEEHFAQVPFGLAQSDPEFSALFSNFAFDEVVHESKLDDKTRFLAVLATLMGCQGVDAFCAMVPGALKSGVTPVEIKELVYQGAAYLGLGRVLPFLHGANAALEKQGVSLPLPEQGSTTPDTRIAAGNQAQVDIFGEGMRGFQDSGPEESRHINRWLAGNCFGDYYTRGGLDYRQRELITFCFLAAQGGCEPQLVSHAAANLRIGNDKRFLIDVVSQCLPYIGYPRSLNALRCINEAAK